MNLIDRYIARAIISATALVLMMLLSIDTVFAMLSELNDVGDQGYDLTSAIWHVALTIPRRCYALFPTAVLLGALVGLGALASNSELVVMRAAGVSNARIVRAAALTGALLSISVFAFGEWVASPSEQLAQELRNEGLTDRALRGSNGLWVRNADRYINIREVLPDNHLRDITIYDFGRADALQAIFARQGRFSDGSWLLFDVERSLIDDDGVHTEQLAELRLSTLVDPALFDVLIVTPESLAVAELSRYVDYLKSNDLDASRYELAFWRKWIAPLTTTVMLLLALPFVFTHSRTSGAGQRLLIGSLIGISYFLIDRLFAQIGLVYAPELPQLSALMPPLVFCAVALALLKRVV